MRVERDRSCAALRRSLGGPRGRVWAEEDALQPLRALGRARHLEGIFNALAGADGASDRLLPPQARRRLAARFDRNVGNFMSAVALAATGIPWL